MDFTFTGEQAEMAETFARLLAEICAPAELRVTAEAKPSAREDRWARMVELGVFGVLAPEAAGGLGLADTDFVLLAQEAGFAALPENFVEHAGIGVPLLAGIAGPGAAELLAGAAAGALQLAVCPQGAPALNAARADVLLVEHEDEVHAVPRERAELAPLRSIDTTRQLAEVKFEPGPSTRLVDAAAGRALWAVARRRGAVYTAAQLCGLASRMTALAVAYSAERKQFGKPIGSNQAVKHLLANVAVRSEFAKPVVYAAAFFINAVSRRAEVYASHAKLAASDAADLAARNAFQVHGAMGYSWEVDLHFYMKRCWALTGAWGDRNFHALRVQSALFEDGIALGPDQVFAC